MKKQEIYKTKIYRDMEEHYKRVCREKRALEKVIDDAQFYNEVLRCALDEQRRALYDWKMA